MLIILGHLLYQDYEGITMKHHTVWTEFGLQLDLDLGSHDWKSGALTAWQESQMLLWFVNAFMIL